jgi:hypothetical protein
LYRLEIKKKPLKTPRFAKPIGTGCSGDEEIPHPGLKPRIIPDNFYYFWFFRI